MKAALSIVFVVLLAAWTPPARAFECSPRDRSGAYSFLPLRLQDPWNDAREDWTRFLSRANDRGIGFGLDYTGEAFHGFRTEPSGKTVYRGLLDVHLGLDTGKAGLWPDGKLFIKVQDGHGRGILVNPGGIVALPITNIEAQDFTQISEFGLKQSFLGGKLRLTVAKQDVNAVFCVNESGGDFTFPSFTLIPTVPMPTFPAPALGVTLLVDLAKEISAGAGFYDGGSKVGRIGFDTFLEGDKGYFSIFEPAWKPAFGTGGQLHGNYRLGLWYHSGAFSGTGLSPKQRSFDGNYGLYVMINQMIYKPGNDPPGDRGLEIFFQFGWAPGDRNEISRYWGGGFTYRGLIPGRSDDIAAVGFGNAGLNGTESGEPKSEMTNVELFYVAQLTSWIALQPDVQYFSNAGPHEGSGLAVGLRSLVSF